MKIKGEDPWWWRLYYTKENLLKGLTLSGKSKKLSVQEVRACFLGELEEEATPDRIGMD